jgi:hypothetical protein
MFRHRTLLITFGAHLVVMPGHPYPNPGAFGAAPDGNAAPKVGDVTSQSAKPFELGPRGKYGTGSAGNDMKRAMTSFS